MTSGCSLDGILDVERDLLEMDAFLLLPYNTIVVFSFRYFYARIMKSVLNRNRFKNCQRAIEVAWIIVPRLIDSDSRSDGLVGVVCLPG